MKIQGREFCLALRSDDDGAAYLGLYEGSMALGAPVAECSRSEADDSISMTTYAADVPSAALEWLREAAPAALPPAGAPPDLDTDRRPPVYYIGGALVLLGDAAYRWIRVAAHGGFGTEILVLAAGLLLLSGYLAHRHDSVASAARY